MLREEYTVNQQKQQDRVDIYQATQDWRETSDFFLRLRSIDQQPRISLFP